MIDIFQGDGAPLTRGAVDATVNTLGQPSDAALLWSLLSVETSGFGYLPDRRLKILFERHVFHNRTKGIFSTAYPDISNPVPGGYSGGAAEYQRLKRAMVLDRTSALESASWGLGQVMGFNASTLGYSSVEDMIEKFKKCEDEQLAGCAAFITRKPALQEAYNKKNWKMIAFFYNGKNYAVKKYDEKLEKTYTVYQQSIPNIEIRTAQAYLTYLGFNPKGIDGVEGSNTKAATEAFRNSYNVSHKRQLLPLNVNLEPLTMQALSEAAGALRSAVYA
jgi:hypothetical protein